MPEQGLTYSFSDGSKPGITVLKLEGPFILNNMFQLQAELRNQKPPCMIMDLTAVPFMDSAGLGVIMNSYVSAQGGGRKFLICGVNDRVKALLEMTKVDSVLQSCDSVEAAEARA